MEPGVGPGGQADRTANVCSNGEADGASEAKVQGSNSFWEG